MKATAPPLPQEISDDLGHHDEITIGPAQVSVPLQEQREYVPARGRQHLILGVDQGDFMVSPDCELR